MKRVFIIILTSFVALLATILVVGEWWVETLFQDVINKKPDRAYDISFEDLELHAFFKGLTLEAATITPLQFSDTTTVIRGTVEYIDISGIKWREFIFAKRADIRELIFINPSFEISLVAQQNHRKRKQSEKGMQKLFGDILSRGKIHAFKLENGSVEARHASDSMLIGKIDNLKLEATDIQTDSIQVKGLIPFKVSGLSSSLDSIYIRLNDHTALSVGYMGFHRSSSSLEINNISLSFTKDRLEVSNAVGVQTDLIEAEVKFLKINSLGAKSNLYSDLDIRARSILIEGLVLKDFRNKNHPRPEDAEKPMFEGMVENISIPFKLDSIIISNANIYYSELGEKKTEPGTVHFSDINANIINVTSIPEFQQQYESFNTVIDAKLNRSAKMNITLDVPYERESFNLHATVNPFDLDILNTTTKPLAGIEIGSGKVQSIDFKMAASKTEAENVLTVNYQDLALSILMDHGHDYKKKGMVSAIANSAIRHANLPDQKHYHVPEYTSYRNVYRGPFNFMWESAKQGMLYIVPTGATGLLVGNPEKRAKKKQEKQSKR